jgi:hypothetical protein
MEGCAMDALGVVEGFYWQEKDKVAGRYREYSVAARIRLFQTMAHLNREFSVGLDTYMYDPKMCRWRNNRGDLAEMVDGALAETVAAARECGIRFIYGLAPGLNDRWEGCRLAERARAIAECGGEIALLFDDVEGGADTRQMQSQARLANEMEASFGVFGICPAHYHGELQDLLEPLYRELDPAIPIIQTGRSTSVWCRSMDRDHIFPFRGQPNIIWDNWMACDSSKPEKLEFKPPLRRTPGFVEGIQAYLLNLCFPEERIVHMIGSLAYLRNQDREATAEIMSHAMSHFLDVPLEVTVKYIRRHTLQEEATLTPSEVSLFNRWPSLGPFLQG